MDRESARILLREKLKTLTKAKPDFRVGDLVEFKADWKQGHFQKGDRIVLNQKPFRRDGDSWMVGFKSDSSVLFKGSKAQRNCFAHRVRLIQRKAAHPLTTMFQDEIETGN